MATGAGLLARARAHIGEEYVNRQVPKDDPNWRGPWDCAEFMSWLVYQEAGILYGCTDNNAAPSKADAYTGNWKKDSEQRGIRIPVSQAAGTVGAILLRFPPAPGRMGHIVLSDGKGGTVEAMGKAYGVRAGTVQGRHWDTGVLIPGIDYGTGATDIAVTKPAVRYAPNVENMSKSAVADIQRALAAKGFDPGSIDGIFGEATAKAVAAFQDSLGLVSDGEVGSLTANALGILLPGMKPELLGSLLGEVGMSPLVAIAASVLPEIIKAIAGDKAGSVATEVSKAVTQATKTSDPQEAKEKLKQDPDALTELQVKLAQIAAEQEEKRQAAQLELLKAQYEEQGKIRETRLKELQEDIKDTHDARSRFAELALANNPMAWGAPLVSIIVTLGFFGILFVLIKGGELKLDSQISQIVNITVGTLAAAFATVVSFWLGSSQGSRNKDFNTLHLQTEQARQTSEVLKTQAQQTEAALQSAGKGATTRQPENETTKAANFRKCVDIVLKHEGGFGDHPRDRGGATNLGITIGTLKEWRGDDSLTADDVKNLKEEEAREIYRTRYWNVMRCDDLPAGVNLAVFDFGVNSGPPRSAKFLQQVVGAKADGAIGPATLAATRAAPPKDVISRICQLRLEYVRGLSNWSTFGRGWTNRINAVEKAALEMVSDAA